MNTGTPPEFAVGGRPVGFHYLSAELGTKDYRCFGVVLEMGIIAIQKINPPDATLSRGSGRGTPVLLCPMNEILAHEGVCQAQD